MKRRKEIRQRDEAGITRIIKMRSGVHGHRLGEKRIERRAWKEGTRKRKVRKGEEEVGGYVSEDNR